MNFLMFSKKQNLKTYIEILCNYCLFHKNSYPNREASNVYNKQQLNLGTKTKFRHAMLYLINVRILFKANICKQGSAGEWVSYASNENVYGALVSKQTCHIHYFYIFSKGEPIKLANKNNPHLQ